LATKTSPKVATSGPIRVTVQGVKVRIGEITCDDLDQFKAVKKVKSAPFIRMSERKFKDGIQKLLGERGKFPDWGGEPNDLFTKALFRGKRVSIAFAFKGPGMQGVLTPGKLGKNGDQIQRLFRSPADIFIVQYYGQIAESVLDQMKAWATLNSVREGKKIWYGIINGDDSNRIMAAYPKKFGLR
ncbi:MAG: hypothetical protein Q8L22_13840, partial [Reyranella sp.]|nr:hypothetical protein [Reyranella sp.]